MAGLIQPPVRTIAPARRQRWPYNQVPPRYTLDGTRNLCRRRWCVSRHPLGANSINTPHQTPVSSYVGRRRTAKQWNNACVSQRQSACVSLSVFFWLAWLTFKRRRVGIFLLVQAFFEPWDYRFCHSAIVKLHLSFLTTDTDATRVIFSAGSLSLTVTRTLSFTKKFAGGMTAKNWTASLNTIRYAFVARRNTARMGWFKITLSGSHPISPSTRTAIWIQQRLTSACLSHLTDHQY